MNPIRISPCGLVDGQTDVTKVVVAFRKFAHSPKVVTYTTTPPIILTCYFSINSISPKCYVTYGSS